MMKKIFLLLLVLPTLLFSQNSLVKWYNVDLSSTMLDSHIKSATLKGVKHLQYWSEDAFYITDGSFSPSPTLDSSKFVQFTLSPADGYQADLTNFAFSVRNNGSSPGQKILVKFSKNVDFSDAQILVGESITKSTYSEFNPSFPANTSVKSGETMFIRMYVYNTNDNLHVHHNSSGTAAPVISGTVRVTAPVKPTVFDDLAETKKNTPVVINVLANDTYTPSGPLSSINVIKPSHGTVQVNDLKTITYSPLNNFVGYDKFYYTVTNAAGVSNTAKVEVQIVDGINQVLVSWNTDKINGVFPASNYATEFITGQPMNVKTQTLDVAQWESSVKGPAFILSNLPKPEYLNGNLNPESYLQLSLKGNAHNIIYLNSFRMKYKPQGGIGKITIKYSKNEQFTGTIYTLVNGVEYNDLWQDKEWLMTEGNTLYPGEQLFVRIYNYNTYNNFLIEFNEKSQLGPSFSGIISTYAPEPIPCQTTVIWNGEQWEGGLPDSDKKVIIAGNYNTLTSGAFEACTLTVNNKAILTVEADHAIIVQNEINTDGGASVILRNEANLIQINDEAVNSGAITVERKAHLKRLDYIYWGSPVKGQELKKFSPGTVDNRFYTYNEGNDFFEVIAPKNNIFGNNVNGFESGAKGYAIRANNNYPASTPTADAPMQVFTGVFTGVPNNGRIDFALKYQSKVGTSTGNGYNLIGNPYPSNIDFDELVNQNKDLINGTAYFWTNVNPTPAMQGSSYPKEGTINNYAILNGAGSIPATQGRMGGVVSKKPTNVIEVGQGFIIKAKKEGVLTFKNSYRTDASDGVFFNKGNVGKEQTVQDRYWLELKTPLDVVTTALVAYVEQATNDYEDRYDAQLLNLGSDALFTKAAEYRLGIQGRAYPLQNTDIVRLGAGFYETGAYTLSLSNTEGIFAEGQNIYLKDKQTGITTNLSENSYTFTADQGLSEDRFEISYQAETTLGTDLDLKNELVVYKSGQDFVIQSSTKMSSVELYDSVGRLVYKVQPHAKDLVLTSESLAKGMYVLKIVQNGQVVSKKILK